MHAGEKSTVTIATNMAGRGTDIKHSEEIKAAGGLAIIGTERHDSRRVDRQLRGRSGRQGDPGSSIFYVSLEDKLMRLFGSERIAGLVEELKLTPEQAEKFAPVYLAYQGEIRKIRKDLKTLMDSYNGKTINEKLAFRMVMDQLNADADIIACKKEYMRVFKDHLNPEQLSKIFMVEKKAMRPQRPGGPHGGPQGGSHGPRE